MNKDKIVRQLMETFLEELEERVGAMNQDLDELEKEPTDTERAELLNKLFRMAHSMKGASRAVGVNLIESACHQLEEILGAARDGRRALDSELLQLVFLAADAIEDAMRRLRAEQELDKAPLAELLPQLEAAAGEDGAAPSVSAPPSPGTPAPPTPSAGAPVPAGWPVPGEAGAVRIPSEKLDMLLGRSGELPVARLRMDQQTKALVLLRDLAQGLRGALEKTSSTEFSSGFAASDTQEKKRVLVVDDSLTTRSLEKSVLEAAGYHVIVAVDGEEAWQLLQEGAVDLVVSNADMPELDGFELTGAIRRSERFKDLPVVLLTGFESEKSKLRGMDAGANAYLVKSEFDQTNLLETIAQLL